MYHPVVSCREAVELETRLFSGEADREWEAMNRAGTALAEAVLLDWREIGELKERPRILILAGKGHNAGDAFIAVREILSKRPCALIDVLFVMGEETLNPLALRAWNGLLAAAAGNSAVVRFFSLDRIRETHAQLTEICGGRYQICLDGMFGMNFRPPYRSPMDEVVRWLNANLRAELRGAVDLPSGLGDAPSDLAFCVDFTYMTGSAKRPLFVPENAEKTGRLRYLDLGFFPDRAAEARSGREVILPEILRPLRALRGANRHKRHYGHLLIVGGSRLMPGAILMSILAAVRSGAGLVTAAVPESLVAGFSAVVPEAMWVGCPETEDGGLALDGLHRLETFFSKATAGLIGPGVGTEPETQAMLESLVAKISIPLVIDAEALQTKVIERLCARPEMRGKVAITPHMGEYARISGRKFADSGEEGMIEYCRETELLALLKGPPFTRFCDGDSISYGLAGGAVLARGGSGDLLSGIAGSQVARAPDEVGEAMRRAMIWHGMAAEALARNCGQEGVRTTELLDFLPHVLRELVEG